LLELAEQWSPVAADELPALPTYRTVRQMSPADVDELLRGWEAGFGVVRLAAQFGVHRHTVAKHLHDRGIDTNEKLSPEAITEAAELYRAGWSLARLSDKYGISDGTVRRRLLEAGVTMRPRPGRKKKTE
jgi:lambda repressor-like predicted transcriptional regulator